VSRDCWAGGVDGRPMASRWEGVEEVQGNGVQPGIDKSRREGRIGAAGMLLASMDGDFCQGSEQVELRRARAQAASSSIRSR